MTEIDLGITADMHVHLRDGKMMELIAPTVEQGGISIAYVMPNLVPPITTIEQVRKYRNELQSLLPETVFLMSFYLCKDLTPEILEQAADEGLVHGVKCYPAGVTTNSKYGVDPNDFSGFYKLFEVMQRRGLILNLHGEKPAVKTGIESDETDIHVMNAEPKFLPALVKLHNDFPKLKIVLEHCTTKAAVDMVRELNQGVAQEDVVVAATITAHHLSLSIDEWAGNPINYCKPVAKLPSDRRALVDAATSGEPWFFYGSDSAPHPIEAKSVHTGVCAGVYTQSHGLSYLAQIFDANDRLSHLAQFAGAHGIAFYKLDSQALAKNKKRVFMVKRDIHVPTVISKGDILVVPFKAGELLQWAVEWR